jgi:murein L,D-transpeptidase YafK
LRLRFYVAMGACWVLPTAWAAADPCAGQGTSIVVHTADSELHLCEGGASTKRFPVALGRKGKGKKAQGDARTPLGTYDLGVPRSSREFGTFIPIAYPTVAERKKGYTGRDVGIHGPKRSFRWAGRINAWFDWTAGCIAVADDPSIKEIAAWVKSKHVRTVRIE